MSATTVRTSSWAAALVVIAALGLGAYWMQARGVPVVPTIAVIPQTDGAMLWEVEHFGAKVAANARKYHLSWSAPTSENDVAGQVSLIDRVSRGKHQGLILAPNHPLAIRAPLRRALAAGLPVVVVAAPLDLPSSKALTYVVNDDDKMGELAAAEIARLLEGEGAIAIVGLSRYAPGVSHRARATERFLAEHFPKIRVAARLAGAYNAARAEELVSGAMDEYPDVKAVVALTAVSTRGAHAAIKGRRGHGSVRLVGCEQDSDSIGYVGSGEIAAVVAINTYQMGYRAVELISEFWAGKPMPARSVVPPLLITRRNFNAAETSLFVSFPR